MSVSAELATKAVGTAVKAAAGTAFAGLGGYVVPVLAGGLLLSLVAGASGTLWYKAKFNSLEAEVAKDVAARQQLVITADARDNELIRKLSEALAPLVSGINRQNQNVQIALGKAKSDPNCVNTDAGRAFDGIVQPSTRKP